LPGKNIDWMIFGEKEASTFPDQDICGCAEISKDIKKSFF
jgi:hypothetical protein